VLWYSSSLTSIAILGFSYCYIQFSARTTLFAGVDFVVAMFADDSTLDPYIAFITEDGTVLAYDDNSGAQAGAECVKAWLKGR
jgi:hypothetical protein